MNLDYKICNILTKKEVYAIRKNLIGQKGWKDGVETTIGFNKNTKNNEENYSLKKYLNIIINWTPLSRSCEFTKFTENITNPIISQMKKKVVFINHI